MSQTTCDALRTEAFRKLEAYLATGIDGFRVQGLDRLRACGVNVDACQDRAGVEHLVAHQMYIG